NRVIDLETGEERVLLDEKGAGGHSDLGFGYVVARDNFNPKPGAVGAWRCDMDLHGGGPISAVSGQGTVSYRHTAWGAGTGHGGEPIAAVSGQGTLSYHHTAWGSGTGHVAHSNARPDAPERQIACSSYASRSDVARQNEIVCYRLDGSLDTLVVAPTLIDLD